MQVGQQVLMQGNEVGTIVMIDEGGAVVEMVDNGHKWHAFLPLFQLKPLAVSNVVPFPGVRK